jgi:hypothetical protein
MNGTSVLQSTMYFLSLVLACFFTISCGATHPSQTTQELQARKGLDALALPREVHNMPPLNFKTEDANQTHQ